MTRSHNARSVLSRIKSLLEWITTVMEQPQTSVLLKDVPTLSKQTDRVLIIEGRVPDRIKKQSSNGSVRA